MAYGKTLITTRPNPGFIDPTHDHLGGVKIQTREEGVDLRDLSGGEVLVCGGLHFNHLVHKEAQVDQDHGDDHASAGDPNEDLAGMR